MEIKFRIPIETKKNPLKVGIIWLYFLSSRNFFKFAVVAPASINGVTWPSPKKNKKMIEIAGFLACDTHAKSVAKTGVMQGEEARPKVPPITNGVRKGGAFSSMNSKLGPFGNWKFKIPNKLRPIIIAMKATKDA